jgi:hypothetical protein
LTLWAKRNFTTQVSAVADNKIIIERPALFAKYGLQSQNQIIAIAGKRVYNAKKLAEAIGQIGEITTEIAALRQGKGTPVW